MRERPSIDCGRDQRQHHAGSAGRRHPALFLAGHALFKRAVFGILSVPRLVAIAAALAALTPAAMAVSPLVLAVAATVIVALVAVADTLALGRVGAAQTKTRVRS